MEPCYDYLEINIFDIWQYERQCFLSSKTDQEHMQKLTTKIQNKIYSYYETKKPISESQPNKIVEPVSRKEGDKYFTKNKNEWNNRVSKGLKELIYLDYFLFKNAFFEYNYDIVIDIKDEDFNYWFCLKLRQYQSNIVKLYDFLNYQFKLNFNEEIKKLKVFLNFIFIQEEQVLFNQKFVSIVEDWLKDLRTNNHKEAPKTYYLDIVRDQPNILKRNDTLRDVFYSLKRNRYLLEGTKYDQFILIFKNNQLKQEEKLKWTGSMKQLKIFIEFFLKKNVCSLVNGIDKWKVATFCFQRKVKGNWVDIEKYTEISDSSGSEKSTIQIKEIGELIEQIK
jgi:hypothetical protein